MASARAVPPPAPPTPSDAGAAPARRGPGRLPRRKTSTYLSAEKPYPERSAEHKRLWDSEQRRADWKCWGPYVSARAWGTVREDYSADGDAWNYFPHDHARSRAYRWNEDGLAGVCNRFQNACLAVALWNGADPILKERMFGLNGNEGNHGEDAKEYWWYLDSTPTHSYTKLLYKYPMDAYPYEQLVRVNKARSRTEPEFELVDALPETWAKSHYFDVFVEYAKADEDDILCCITAVNRSRDRTAPLHILPHLWYRNTWSWGWTDDEPRPEISRQGPGEARASERHLGDRCYYVCAPVAAKGAAAGGVGSSGGDVDVDGDGEGSSDAPGLTVRAPTAMLFTENDTNNEKLFGADAKNATPYVKDAFHEYVVNGRTGAVNPEGKGTKCAAHFQASVAPGQSFVVWVRYSKAPHKAPFADFADVVRARRTEADHFYSVVQESSLSDDDKLVQRQAFAGVLMSKQFYHFGVDMWLRGDPGMPAPPKERLKGRNSSWRHLYNCDVISMPDNWEYPWYAAWDLAFHTITIALVDTEWAKRQLILMTREWYMHPSGALPAYEWNFGDVNPPVHAWACLRVYKIAARIQGRKDLTFLERVFHKLMLNFTWWTNRKDAEGKNLFEGGFLGLDNIGVFDRSHALPAGTTLEQADGTAWMGMFCLNMLAIAVELALANPAYEDVCTKFFEHFVVIARSMNDTLWDAESGFYFDVLRYSGADGEPQRRFVRCKSFVGLVPMFAVTTLSEEALEKLPAFRSRVEWYVRHRAELTANVMTWFDPKVRGRGSGAKAESESAGGPAPRRLLSLVSPDKLRAVLAHMLDEKQFLSPYGLRSMSKAHEEEPFVFEHGEFKGEVRYEPAESSLPMYGGNSNWRGPIWLPVNYLMIESLQQYDYYHGDDFKVACPTGSCHELSLWDVSQELAVRLCRIFGRSGAGGRRPVNGGVHLFSDDAHWGDLVTFYEYFGGDDGAGCGASHQTGWTSLVAKLLQQIGAHSKHVYPPTPMPPAGAADSRAGGAATGGAGGSGSA